MRRRLSLALTMLLGCSPPPTSPAHEPAAHEPSPAASSAEAKAAPRKTLTGAELRAEVTAHTPQMRDCYTEGLRRDPKIKGRLAVRFRIRQDGSVEGAALEPSSDMADPEVAGCVLEVVNKMRFPAHDAPRHEVVLPLNFAPAPAASSSAPAGPPP